MKIPRIVIAGATSGVGKTLITCAIIYALKNKGYSVQPFKVGPDFIDPSYHGSISGNIPRNLDVWMMEKNGVLQCFTNNSKSDVSIVEGVMGYYDGFSGRSSFSSTHDVANIIKSNVILVIDAGKAARSIGAIAFGFKHFERNSRICGVILNNIGSTKHEQLCREAFDKIQLPIVGVIPRNNNLRLDSRHLGLIPVKEQSILDKKILDMSKILVPFLDVSKIIKFAKKSPSLIKTIDLQHRRKHITIAVALDQSFNFYYQDNIDVLKNLGAEIKYFSPVLDSDIPTCDGIYIGGGFPEVKADLLARNHKMKRMIKKLAEDGMPIYAECGGLMYLTRSIKYKTRKFPMIGIFDAVTVMEKKLKLNYTLASMRNNPVFKSSIPIHGHEFHYSELDDIEKDAKFVYDMKIGIGIKNKKDGMLSYNTIASYMHVHFTQNQIAEKFVNTCMKYSKK